MSQFQSRIEPFLGKNELDICWNKNLKTVIRVIQLKRGYALLSLHFSFQEAPSSVLKAIADFVFGKGQAIKNAKIVLKKYIEESFQKIDLSGHYPKKKLVHEGDVYNLQEVYQKVNKDYFDQNLDLQITWYGRMRMQRRRSITFGEYVQLYKLVKIHKQLDQETIPDFYLEFVVYHEMLHSVIPSYVNEKGVLCMHGKEFRTRERAFKRYNDVKDWEKANQKLFFL